MPLTQDKGSWLNKFCSATSLTTPTPDWSFLTSVLKLTNNKAEILDWTTNCFVALRQRDYVTAINEQYCFVLTCMNSFTVSMKS